MATKKQTITPKGAALARARDQETFAGFDRTEAPAYSRSIALQKSNELRKARLQHERDDAESSHADGERLNEAFVRKIDQVLGYATFSDFTLDAFNLSPTAARDKMLFARFVTAEQATAFGFSRCVLGARIAMRLGRKDLTALRKLPLLDETGVTVKFNAATPVRALQSVLRQLDRTSLHDGRPPEGDSMEALLGVLETESARSPALKAMRIRLGRFQGEIEVRSRPPRGAAELRAFAALLLKLAALK